MQFFPLNLLLNSCIYPAIVFAFTYSVSVFITVDYPRFRESRRDHQTQGNGFHGQNKPLKRRVTNSRQDAGLPDFAALLADPIILGLEATQPETSHNVHALGSSTLRAGKHVNLKRKHKNPRRKAAIHTNTGAHGKIKSDIGHLPTGSSNKLKGVIALAPGDHIDLALEHNSPHNEPTIHKADGTRLHIKPAAGGLGHMKDHLPSEHVHTGASNKLPGVIALAPGDHIDLALEHNSPHNEPTIHKADGTRLHITPAAGGLGHLKDHLPSEHVHTGPQNKLQGVIALAPGDHIDFALEHNSPHNEPTIHKADGTRLHIKPAAGGLGHLKDHLPSEHVHTGASNKLPGVIALAPGDHIDLALEHNSPHNEPTIHKADGTRLHIKPAAGGLGHLKDHLPSEHVHTGASNKLPGVIALAPGDHIDFAFQHKSKHNKPTIHKADGTRVPIKPDIGHLKDHLPSEHVHTGASSNKPRGVIAFAPGDFIDIALEHSPHNKPTIHKADGTRLHIKPVAGGPFDTMPKVDTLPGSIHLRPVEPVHIKGEHKHPHSNAAIRTNTGNHVEIKPDIGHLHDHIKPAAGSPFDTMPTTGTHSGSITLPLGDYVGLKGKQSSHQTAAINTNTGVHRKIKPDIGHSKDVVHIERGAFNKITEVSPLFPGIDTVFPGQQKNELFSGKSLIPPVDALPDLFVNPLKLPKTALNVHDPVPDFPPLDPKIHPIATRDNIQVPKKPKSVVRVPDHVPDLPPPGKRINPSDPHKPIQIHQKPKSDIHVPVHVHDLPLNQNIRSIDTHESMPVLKKTKKTLRTVNQSQKKRLVYPSTRRRILTPIRNAKTLRAEKHWGRVPMSGDKQDTLQSTIIKKASQERTVGLPPLRQPRPFRRFNRRFRNLRRGRFGDDSEGRITPRRWRGGRRRNRWRRRRRFRRRD